MKKILFVLISCIILISGCSVSLKPKTDQAMEEQILPLSDFEELRQKNLLESPEKQPAENVAKTLFL